MRPFIAAAFLLLASLTPRVSGQIGYLWTFDELKARADVVAIAECLTTTDTGHEALHPGLSPALPVVEMRGDFRVLAVLKAREGNGIAVGAALNLFYYRHDQDRWQRDHPRKPGQPPPGLLNAGCTLDLERGAKYLLFLVPGPDGSYQPLSGHTFPDESVYLLWNRGRRCPTMRCT